MEPILKRPISAPRASCTAESALSPVSADMADAVLLGWCDQAVPDSLDSGNVHGAHQCQRHQAMIGFELGDDPLISGKQIGQGLDGMRPHTEQPAGHIGLANQASGERHVQPVVVPWRQVDSRETAIAQTLGGSPISAQQRQQRIVPALGLKDSRFVDITDGRHGAVGRGSDVILARDDRASFGFQGSGEKFIEGAVVRKIRIHRVVHIDIENAGEFANSPGRQ